jgi:hypothetical protein
MSEQTASQKNTHRELKIIIEVNEAAEQFYPESVKLGEHAADVITNRHRSQLTNLENVANSAFKSSDVFDYIKRQTARYNFWRQPHKGQSDQQPFGERLLKQLEQSLKGRRDYICTKLEIGDTTDEDRRLRRHVYLLLIRQFIRQMVVQYEYQTSILKEQKRG